jgi:hypothetical protein
MLAMKIWIGALAFLTFNASTSAALSQTSATSATSSSQASEVDVLAAELSNRFTSIREGPTLLKVPLSYRFAAICNAQTKQTLENYFFKSFSATGSVLLTKQEQLPAQIRTVANCPQCSREATYKTRINNTFSEWLRATPQSFREEAVTFCETRV